MEAHHSVRPPPPQPPLPAPFIQSLQPRDSYNEKDIKDYGDYREQGSIELSEDESDSPIEEVRVTISNRDDPSTPYNTFRMWFLGLIFTAIISFVNQFFYLRQTSISIGYSIVALLSLPLGHFLARVLPTRRFRIPLLFCLPTSRYGFSFTLNPGPFSIKEHVLIGTMAACNTSTAYAVDIVILQKVFYHDEKPFLAGLLLVLTTQITGFAIAGALRRFLVRPSQMVWPSTLVTASLFRGLHARQGSSNTPPSPHIDQEVDTGPDESSESDSEEGSRTPRSKYFLWVTLGSFLWYWFPGLIFPTVGTIAWICWIQPDNVVLAQLTGANGLGIGTLTLDWSAASYYVGPLITPWFAQVNILVGFVFVAYILVPWAYYTNLWDSQTFPIISANLFLQNGTFYDVSTVMGQDGFLDETLYQQYGPLRMTSFLALTYGIGFAGLTATVVHTVLYHGKDMLARYKSTFADREDVHSRLMRSYPEVPDWWYMLLFLITVTLSFVTCAVYDLMPWWALILALVMAIAFVLPVGIVTAVTNQQPGLNIVTEYVIGYLLPGHAIANVTFKTYGYIVNVQALTFTADLKLGHYMKIPPQIMFLVQVVSSIVACVINLGTATWLIHSRPKICTDEGYPFTCRSTRTFHSASVIWGAIGPARVFGSKDGAIYSPVTWGFLLGAVLPLLFWTLARQFPKVEWLKLVHWPVLFAATSNMPPALPYFYSNGLLIGFVFAFLLRRYRYPWWSRYNYLTSAALDTGVALAGLVIFFVIQAPGLEFPHWWGNPDTSQPDVSLDHCAYGGRNFYGHAG
ncbi:hypothetical protein BGZ75_000704 [Mortierella antarctica]|nr:hypothetical protein BGZ75_000704 [Mortierella antarctica]